jgi:hypothetical protein
MAVPTVPTVTSILTESFRRCGVPSPTVAQLTRAEDEWFEEVKQELGMEKRWHNYEETMVLIPQAYAQVYAIPSPLDRIFSVSFFSGVTGTATAGGATSITLAAGGDVLGRKIFLTGGTGAGQCNRILSLGGLVATVAATWATTPDSSTTYMIATYEFPVSGPHVGLPRTGIAPTNIITRWEQFEHQLVVYPVPNASTYALELRGMVDISLVDRTDARLTRILREMRPALIAGVMVRIKEDQQDEDLPLYRQRYEQITLKMMKHDSRKHRSLLPMAMRGPGGIPRRRNY